MSKSVLWLLALQLHENSSVHLCVYTVAVRTIICRTSVVGEFLETWKAHAERFGGLLGQQPALLRALITHHQTTLPTVVLPRQIRRVTIHTLYKYTTRSHFRQWCCQGHHRVSYHTLYKYTTRSPFRQWCCKGHHRVSIHTLSNS